MKSVSHFSKHHVNNHHIFPSPIFTFTCGLGWNPFFNISSNSFNLTPAFSIPEIMAILKIFNSICPDRTSMETSSLVLITLLTRLISKFLFYFYPKHLMNSKFKFFWQFLSSGHSCRCHVNSSRTTRWGIILTMNAILYFKDQSSKCGLKIYLY